MFVKGDFCLYSKDFFCYKITVEYAIWQDEGINQTKEKKRHIED